MLNNYIARPMPIMLIQPKKSVIVKGVVATLLMVFGVALLGAFFLQFSGLATYIVARFVISRVLYCCCLLLVWFYCTRFEKQKMLLWEETQYPFLFYLLSIIVIFIILLIGSGILAKVFIYAGVHINQAREKRLSELLKGNYALILIVSLTAGIIEELIFRGYLMPRLAVMFNKKYIAVIISSALFGLLHFGYNNWFHIVGAAFIGLVFALHYVKYQNIKVLILCHFLWDFVLLLINTR